LQSIARSLLVPALLSVTSLAVTVWWFDKLEREASLGAPDAQPIAYLKAARDPIERRTKSRIMWQTLGEGGPLYSGDAIRTPPRTEGSVQLIQDETIVTLEADSLIVLEDTQGRLELNLVSGALLVEKRQEAPGKPAATTAKGPVIRSGKTRLELGAGAEVSLARAKGAEATVAVAKGQVEVAAGAKSLMVNAGQVGTVGSDGGVKAQAGIEATSPAPGAVIVLERADARVVAFAWRPLEEKGSVRLELGPQRTELHDAGAPANPATGALRAEVPAGTFYWRLVLRGSDGKVLATSPVLRAEGVVPTPPSLYGPEALGSFVLAKDGVDVQFSWSRPARARDLTLQIARDATFSRAPSSTPVGDEQQRTMRLKSEGTYFWRVVARVDGVQGTVSSETRRFSVLQPEDVPAPALLRPAAAAALDESTVKANGVFLEWEKVPTAARYRVQVSAGGKVKSDEKVATAGQRLDGLLPGSYAWRVQALTEDGRESPWSVSRQFAVKRLPELRWSIEGGAKQDYVGEKPLAKLAWERGPDAARSWRFRSATSRAGLESAAWTATKRPEAVSRHAAEGTYFYEAQALDGKGLVVAASKPTALELRPSLEVDPPTLLAGKGDLKAAADGSITLKWSEVRGAKAYRVEIRDVQRGKTSETRSERTQHQLVSLLPGRYELRLRSEGRTSKPGKFGKTRIVVVPATSDAAPPESFDVKVH
jgi:hypothetical protein